MRTDVLLQIVSLCMPKMQDVLPEIQAQQRLKSVTKMEINGQTFVWMKQQLPLTLLMVTTLVNVVHAWKETMLPPMATWHSLYIPTRTTDNLLLISTAPATRTFRFI